MDKEKNKFVCELKVKIENEKIINEQLNEKEDQLLKQEEKTKDILSKH
jgi:hypothetical protein